VLPLGRQPFSRASDLDFPCRPSGDTKGASRSRTVNGLSGQHTVLACPRLAMDFRPSGGRCKQESPESACPFCGGPGRIKAHRLVKSQVILDDAGKPVRIEGILRIRRQCRACLRSWTVYEQGGYPHRTFTLAVAATAVAELVATPGATRSSVARGFLCDRRSVGRWAVWIAGLADPDHLSRACVRLDPSGLPAPRLYSDLGRLALAGLLLLLLDHLARLLRERGVPLAAGPGPAAILRWQFDRFRTISHLTRASPPLRISPASVPV